MFSKRCCGFFLIGVLMFAASCDRTSKSPVVRLQETAVPPQAFSAAGETAAFQATGEPGKTQQVELLLDRLRARVGKFDRAVVYEFSGDKRLSRKEVKVAEDSSISVPATAGNRYLVYADLGERYSNSYQVACRLGQLRLRADLVPRICEQIYCTRDTFRASELTTRVPELRGDNGTSFLGNQLVGGFGGGGNVCDRCLGDGVFYPVEECSRTWPGGVTATPSHGTFVYDNITYSSDTERTASQIFRMDPNGSVTNLSHNKNVESFPDVSRDQRIVFNRPDVGIFTMDLNGGNVTEVPNTVRGTKPKWIYAPEPFLLFVEPIFSNHQSIHYIRPDGVRRTQVTNPGPRESDQFADRIDLKYMVFERADHNARFDPGEFGLDVFGGAFVASDLYVKAIWEETSPEERVTNTPGLIESLPTGSNITESLFAYRVFNPADKSDRVKVATLTNVDGTWNLNVLHTITPQLPMNWGISGISFSAHDDFLYISTRANDVTANVEARKYEIFYVKLDGSEQRRLTTNTDHDAHPSAVPDPP